MWHCWLAWTGRGAVSSSAISSCLVCAAASAELGCSHNSCAAAFYTTYVHTTYVLSA